MEKPKVIQDLAFEMDGVEVTKERSYKSSRYGNGYYMTEYKMAVRERKFNVSRNNGKYSLGNFSDLTLEQAKGIIDILIS